MRRGEPYHTLFHTRTFTELLLTPEPDAQPGIELPGGLIAPLRSVYECSIPNASRVIHA